MNNGEKELLPFEPSENDGFRCRDCKFYTMEVDRGREYFLCLFMEDMSSDDYCSYGAKETLKELTKMVRTIDGFRFIPKYDMGELLWTVTASDGTSICKCQTMADALIYKRIYEEDRRCKTTV